MIIYSNLYVSSRKKNITFPNMNIDNNHNKNCLAQMCNGGNGRCQFENDTGILKRHFQSGRILKHQEVKTRLPKEAAFNVFSLTF
jgi:hypothetical protein